MRARWIVLAMLAAVGAWCADPPKSDLTLKDGGGQKVRLRDLRGRPVVLNFWATWCVPCNAEMPMLVEMEKQYASRGVRFVGASLDDAKTRGKIAAFVAAHQIAFPVWYDATADDLADLKLGGAVPATAFLDAEGRIQFRILGQARPEEVKERLEWLTAEKPGPPPAVLVKHLDGGSSPH
jgi:thiol-disulfide isomerase/thioredoxin